MSDVTIDFPLSITTLLNTQTTQARYTWRSLQADKITCHHVPLYVRGRKLVVVKAFLHVGDTVTTVCLKLRCSLGLHARELHTYNDLLRSNAHTAFVPILAALELESWGILCMPYLSTPITHIVSVSAKPSACIELEKLAQQHAAFVRVGTSHGMPVEQHMPHAFELSLLLACFRLLQHVHCCGWVHGDTHLGNFMLDTDSWSVYLIDMERSFPCTSPVQHLLDAQELFGHCTGILLSLSDYAKWDMTDVYSLVSRMHPLHQRSPRFPFLHFIPVCTCFAYDNDVDRKHGCSMCTSSKNMSVANRYALESPEWLASTTKALFEDLLYQIKLARMDARQHVNDMAARLTLHWPVMQQKVQESRLLKDKLPSVFANSNITSWLAYILYKGVLVPNGDKVVQALARLLRRCHLDDVAHDLLALTC